MPMEEEQREPSEDLMAGNGGRKETPRKAKEAVAFLLQQPHQGGTDPTDHVKSAPRAVVSDARRCLSLAAAACGIL